MGKFAQLAGTCRRVWEMLYFPFSWTYLKHFGPSLQGFDFSVPQYH
jgi:hypothetical protein